MNLLEEITKDMITAMKEKDSFKLGVIRMAKGAIGLEAINKRKELDNNEIIDVISKQIKLRKDSINEFAKAGRMDLVKTNEEEIEILNKYMPTQLSEEEIDKIINDAFNEVNPTSPKDMGLIMKFVTPLVKGKADMGLINSKIKAKLSNL